MKMFAYKCDAFNQIKTKSCKLPLRMCLHQEYCGLDGLSLSDVLDLVEQSRDTLDGVWRQLDYEPYPETRMVRLMDVIGEN